MLFGEMVDIVTPEDKMYYEPHEYIKELDAPKPPQGKKLPVQEMMYAFEYEQPHSVEAIYEDQYEPVGLEYGDWSVSV